MPKLIGARGQRLAVRFRYQTTVRGNVVQTAIERPLTFGADLNALQGSESSREGRLHVVSDLLVPKKQNAVLLECRADRLISLITCRNVDQSDAA